MNSGIDMSVDVDLDLDLDGKRDLQEKEEQYPVSTDRTNVLSPSSYTLINE